jgi:hypothetical protein
VVDVIALGPVRRDLDVVVARADRHSPEPVQVQRPSEELLDLLRCRARRDVPVVRVDAADRVAHGSAHDVRVVACFAQLLHDALDIPGHAQLGDGHRLSLAEVAVSGYNAGIS